MPKAITNTSPLLYLYRVEAINWLANLFDEVWTSEAVKDELLAGRSKGYDVPNPANILGSGSPIPSLCHLNGWL
jgi:hypothetical protein